MEIKQSSDDISSTENKINDLNTYIKRSQVIWLNSCPILMFEKVRILAI